MGARRDGRAAPSGRGSPRSRSCSRPAAAPTWCGRAGGVRITLQFHPDWPFRGRRVIEALADDGVYRSQFETGTSNGGLTAHPGGDRWRWESRIFGGRYDDAPPARAPAVRRRQPRATTPTAARSGSARRTCGCGPRLLERSTFCFPDSDLRADRVGGPERLDGAVRPGRRRGVARGRRRPRRLRRGARARRGAPGRRRRGGRARSLLPRRARARGRGRRSAARSSGTRAAGAHRRARPRLPRARVRRRWRGRSATSWTPRSSVTAARSGDHDPQSLKRVWHLLARFGRS